MNKVIIPRYIYAVCVTCNNIETPDFDSITMIEFICRYNPISFWFSPHHAQAAATRTTCKCLKLDHALLDHRVGIIVYELHKSHEIYLPIDICVPVLVEGDTNIYDAEHSRTFYADSVVDDDTCRIGTTVLDNYTPLPYQQTSYSPVTRSSIRALINYEMTGTKMGFKDDCFYFYGEHGYLHDCEDYNDIESDSTLIFLTHTKPTGLLTNQSPLYIMKRREYASVAKLMFNTEVDVGWRTLRA